MYYFIVNPKSRTGKGQREWDEIEPELKKRGVLYKRYFTHYEFHAIKIARKICLEHPEPKIIVILGGDGTVNEVVNGITHFENVILGYIPSGSSNDFARSLGIPSNPMEALEKILQREQIRTIDYGTVTLDGRTRRYAGSAGIGYDASVCKEVLESPVKKFFNSLRLGKLAYLAVAVRQMLTYPLCTFRIRIDESEEEVYPHVFFTAPMIQPYEGGGMKMSPDARMDDGLLTACIIYQMSKLKAFLLMPSTFWGKQFRFRGTRQVHCKRLELWTEKALPVHTDGEYAGTASHVLFEISDEKISIIT